MSNYIPSKQIEEYLRKIDEIEAVLKAHIKEDAERAKMRDIRFTQVLGEQRERIVSLQKNLDNERQDRRIRRAQAICEIKGE